MSFNKLQMKKNRIYLKRAFLRSVLIHFLFISILYAQYLLNSEVQNDYLEFYILSELESPEAVTQDVKDLNKSQERDQVKMLKTNKRKANASKSSKENWLSELSEMAEKASRKSGTHKDERTAQDQDGDFISQFEESLYNKNRKTFKESQRPRPQAKKDEHWNEKETLPSQKTRIYEKGKSPSAKTGTVKWKGGGHRKIRYRPVVEYPLYYRRQGIQTTAKFSIRVDSTGNVVGLTLIRSTGYSKLDVIAENVLRKTKFENAPKVNSHYDEGEVSIHFKLKD